MIVDSSALIAILKREPEAPASSKALNESNAPKISAATLLEASIVVDGWKNPTLSRRLDEVIVQFGIEIEPVTAEQAHIARQAYRDYGRSSSHPAHLNFGDCFSYALARAKRESLLFKGDDFNHTDLRSALERP
jgi:ribonuclease VapC